VKEENKQKKMSDLLMLLVEREREREREREYGSTDLPSHVYQHDSKRTIESHKPIETIQNYAPVSHFQSHLLFSKLH
jgi:hypothetical protein